jgi:hypothetical protein
VAGIQPLHIPIIYIDPEETVTDVRQRVAQSEAAQVILVVPPQTRLRGSLAWKVLARSAQRLGKGIVVVSKNPHVHIWAQQAGFQVRPEPGKPPQAAPSQRMGKEKQPSSTL